MKPERLMGIRIKTFDFFDITYNGKSIFFEKQATLKLKSLFQYFVINKDKACHPSKIIGDLWPDNEYSDEKKVLQTYVHRLRNILIKDNVFKTDFTRNISLTSYKGSYQLVISDDVELDTDAFNELVSNASALASYGEIVEACDAMLKLYTGHFLQDSSDEFIVVKLQNHYIHTFYATMLSYLRKLEKMEKYTDIIRICEAIFLVDDLDEAINVVFIRALVETKQVDYVSRHYSYITKKMREVLDIEPSAEMLSLYRNFKSLYGEEAAEAAKAPAMDESRLRGMINEIVSEQLDSQKTTYSILKLDVTVRDGAVIYGDVYMNMNVTELLKHVMLNALRKKDVYAIVDNNTAVAMLYDAKQESYPIIEARVMDCLRTEYPGYENEFDVNIMLCQANLIV